MQEKNASQRLCLKIKFFSERKRSVQLLLDQENSSIGLLEWLKKIEMSKLDDCV